MYQRRAGDPKEGTWLPKDKLEVGAFYYGKCRNAGQAQWNGKVFIYKRTKFGDTFLEEIEHPEDDRGFDVFFPFEKIEK